MFDTVRGAEMNDVILLIKNRLPKDVFICVRKNFPKEFVLFYNNTPYYCHFCINSNNITVGINEYSKTIPKYSPRLCSALIMYGSIYAKTITKKWLAKFLESLEIEAKKTFTFCISKFKNLDEFLDVYDEYQVI